MKFINYVSKIEEIDMGKKRIKKNILSFMIGSFIFGTLSVYAITYFPSISTAYDNSNSDMTSTNVQDAIDELYIECTKEPTAGDTILDNTDIVTSGDGLYEDEYEDGKYTYKGANPNNYVTFNNETAGWRIVSINSDGTIKIMRKESIGIMAWDSPGSNNWTLPADLNTYLNGSYLTETLNATAQSQIVAKDWNIGSVTWDNNDLADQIKDEKTTTWNGKVALITVSEYIRSNSNQSSCGTHALIQANYSSCKNTTWMFNSSMNWWTLSPNAGDSFYVFGVRSYGYVSGNNAYTLYAVRPAVYLSSSVQITGGDGSQNDPYTLSEI